ncbi:MAG: hypothetical protein M3Y03_00085 [Verrucomicrobiota bacterium]|nr:hypothetical protein [Verrucomicrobiota bacterium]
MKIALLLFLSLVALASAHTRWPDALMSGVKQGRVVGGAFADNHVPMPGARELRGAAEAAADAVSCPAAMRAEWLRGYQIGFREGYQDHAQAMAREESELRELRGLLNPETTR